MSTSGPQTNFDDVDVAGLVTEKPLKLTATPEVVERVQCAIDANANADTDVIGMMATILSTLGMDIEDPSMKRTPERFIKMLREYMQPFDPAVLLGTAFESSQSSSVVTQSDIPFSMLCEHHLMPAFGKAYIAYLPGDGRVVGLSKLARLVHSVGRERPYLQESINDRIANLLKEHLKAQGVLVVIKAEHSCMTCRGVNTPGVITTTSMVKGAFRDVPHLRAEAFALLGLN